MKGGVGEGEEEGEGTVMSIRVRVAVLQAAGEETLRQSPQTLCLQGLGMDVELLHQTGNGTRIRIQWAPPNPTTLGTSSE